MTGMICDFIGGVSVSEGLEGGRPREKVGNWERKERGNGDDEERARKRNIKSSVVSLRYLNGTP